MVLGLELLTINFGIVPLAVFSHRAKPRRMLANWGWVFVGNLFGALIYAAPLYIVLTGAGREAAGPLGDQIRVLRKPTP